MDMLFQCIRNKNIKLKKIVLYWLRPNGKWIIPPRLLHVQSLHGEVILPLFHMLKLHYSFSPYSPYLYFPQLLLCLDTIFTQNSSPGMIIIGECDGIEIGSFLISNWDYKPEVPQHIFFNDLLFYQCRSLNLDLPFTFKHALCILLIYIFLKQHGSYHSCEGKVSGLS